MADRNNFRFCVDPLQFCRVLWPRERYYDKQREILYSLDQDDETVAVAANEMGKDFIAARAAIWFFCTRPDFHRATPKHGPCRIVTSSAVDAHLRVLWSEINNAIRTSAVPLTTDLGGPLLVQHQAIYWVDPKTQAQCPVSYIIGQVSSEERIAQMGGHHVPNVGDGIARTMWMCDEASSARDSFKDVVDGWATRKFIFGNAFECRNFFYRAVKGDRRNKLPGGDIIRDYTEQELEEFNRRHPNHEWPKSGPAPRGYHRRVFHIKATDSPNVKLALEERAKGLTPSGRTIINGVKSWDKYQTQLKMWDPIQRSIKLDAEFYEGAEVKLYPKEWLDRAEAMAVLVAKKYGARRRAKGMGVDPAEGGDKTAIAVCDEHGLLDLVHLRTPNTAVIRGMVLGKMKEWSIDPEHVCFDRGGGGKQIADTLRESGCDVRTISFGEPIARPVKMFGGVVTGAEKLEEREDKYTYKTKRAQMWGRLREMLDPEEWRDPEGGGRWTWAIPTQFLADLREELEPVPLKYGKEGELFLPPKNKTPTMDSSREDKTVTLTELIGHSPDLADAVVLAIEAMSDESGMMFEVGGRV